MDNSYAKTILGRFGVWRGVEDVTPDLAADLEALGYSALWLGSSPGGDLAVVDELLDATSTLVIATGIVNIWQSDAHQTAAAFARIEGRTPGRFLLGIGAGHREATAEYANPYTALNTFVDTVLADGVPARSLVLAALGPKVLRLARDRTAGAHPYLVTLDYTRSARAELGANPLLAVEQKVVVEADPQAARAVGRPKVRNPYLHLSNYTANLRRLGWSEEDIADPGSDALIDALVAHGTPEQIGGRLRGHLDAGADHVCVQLLTPAGVNPHDGYAQIAEVLW